MTAVRDETATARTLVLDVPQWSGHLAGQHLDVRLTAEDGYTAVRSYSIASAPDDRSVEITVETVADGEVSPYLSSQLPVGAALDVRGPLGGWFVWRPEQSEPVQLVAGGSGVVPLMSVVRAHAAASSPAPLRLLYSAREPATVLYRRELAEHAARGGVTVCFTWTRARPEGQPGRIGRLDASSLADATWPAEAAPTCYVCGPTPFVEVASQLLVDAGHDPARIRTERFGAAGGPR